MDGTIHVSISSYRDPELEKTIEDCRRKAARPERLTFGIHWQHDSHDFIESLFDRNVRVIDTYYKDSRGTCWARHEAQKLYGGEDYILQLDSHMRFVHGWDLICIDGLKQLQEKGNRRVIISNLMPSYEPDNEQNLPQRYLSYKLGEFTRDGSLQLRSVLLPGAPRERFSPGLSISAAFLFSIGDLFKEVKVDPDLYFEGEEITYAVRAYTYGYDIYHCHYPIVYHYYARKTDRRHWDDHNDWGRQSISSKARLRSLLMGTKEVLNLGPYGPGPVRTIRDYEQYAGVDFTNRLVFQPGEKHYRTPEESIRARLRASKIGILQIDPFSYCNARCWFCPVRYYPQPPRAKRHMPIEILEKIIKDICEERQKEGLVSNRFDFVYTAHYNEILLYRHFAEMLDVFRKYGLRTMVLTNGIPFTRQKTDTLMRYKDVVGGTVVNISAFEREAWIENTIAGNGLKPEKMQRMFDRVMDHIGYAHERLGNISVRINEPDNGKAERQVDQARRLFPGLNVQVTRSLSDRAGVLHDAGIVSNRDAIERSSSGKKDVVGCSNTFTGIDGRHFGWLHINALGKAILCCNDYHFDYTFGDFTKASLKEIWASREHIAMIARSFGDICTRCSSAVWR